MNFYIIVSIIFCFNTYFFNSKSSKLTNLAGVAHDVLSIFILLLYSFYMFLELNFSFIIFFREKHFRRKYIFTEQCCGG